MHNSKPTHRDGEQPRQKDPEMSRIRRLTIVIGLLVAGLALAGTPADSGVVAAQTNNSTLNETAPYYANETSLENQSGWFPNGGNVSLDTLGEMSTRLGPYIIGTGDQIPGGTTYAGTIITGLAMVAVFVGAVGYTSIGSTGGIVVASTIGYGMTSIGLAPGWLKIVLLMIIGLIAAVAALRVTQ
jgi:hypothetical protein